MKKLSQNMVYVLVFFIFVLSLVAAHSKFNDGSEWNFSGCYSNQVLLLISVLKPSCFTVGHSGSLIFANSSPLHTCKHFFGSAACRRALHLIVRSWPNKIHSASFGVVYLVDLQAVWFSTPNPAWALTGNENYKISFITAITIYEVCFSNRFQTGTEFKHMYGT